jgi:hypothetical protein
MGEKTHKRAVLNGETRHGVRESRDAAKSAGGASPSFLNDCTLAEGCPQLVKWNSGLPESGCQGPWGFSGVNLVNIQHPETQPV